MEATVMEVLEGFRMSLGVIFGFRFDFDPWWISGFFGLHTTTLPRNQVAV